MRTTEAVKRIKEINKEIIKLESSIPIPPGKKVYIDRNFYTDTLFEQLCTGKIDPEYYLKKNKMTVDKFKLFGEYFLELYNFYNQKSDIDEKIKQLKTERFELQKQVGLRLEDNV